MATKGRGEATYRKLLAEGEARGWSMREVSRRSGIPYWTLVGWKRRLSTDRQAPSASTVLPVTVVDTPPQPEDHRDDGESRVVLHLRASGHRLVLPAALSPEDLARVVRALESSGC